MIEKRFTIEESENQLIIFDNGVSDETYFHLGNDERDVKYVCDLLNELFNENDILKQKLKTKSIVNKQYEEMKGLQKENEQLRQMIKENVFQRYREVNLADLKFKAIAYDDIVKVEMSYESEPRVIVICKQGKKENVKSFCQMFIPFGVYSEIKELEDE